MKYNNRGAFTRAPGRTGFIMWNFMDPQSLERMQKHAERLRPLAASHNPVLLRNLARSRPELERMMRRSPSPEQMSAMQRAADAVRSIDPANIRALQNASHHEALASNLTQLQRSLGPEGMDAARLLAGRVISRGLEARYGTSADRPGEDAEAIDIAAETLEAAQDLAASDQVRQLMEDLDPDALVAEAAEILEREGVPEVVPGEEDVFTEQEAHAGEAQQKTEPTSATGPFTLVGTFLILFLALQGTSHIAPELAADIRQMLDDISDVITPVLAYREISESGDRQDNEDRREDREPGEGATATDPAIRLIDELLDADPSYDRETWPQIREALEANRLSDRRLFAN